MFRALSDWAKYGRLVHYPALAGFGRAEALARLQTYERVERAAMAPWPMVFACVLVVICVAGWIVVWLGGFPQVVNWMVMLPVFVCNWTVQIVLHRRIKNRVNAKIAAELGDGRLANCFKCGYDVRASEDRCSECGASIRVGPVL